MRGPWPPSTGRDVLGEDRSAGSAVKVAGSTTRGRSAAAPPAAKAAAQAAARTKAGASRSTLCPDRIMTAEQRFEQTPPAPRLVRLRRKPPLRPGAG